MAGILAILLAVARLERRELRSFLSVSQNNFFLFVLFLVVGNISGVEMGGKISFTGSGPFLLIIGLVLFLPLSTDPLSRVPSSRLHAWPLSYAERLLLRAGSVLISPIFWLACILFIVKMGIAIAAVFFLSALTVQICVSVIRHVFEGRSGGISGQFSPRLPAWGGGILTLSVRQIISTLDFYLAAVIGFGGCYYRWFSEHPDPAAFPILAMLVALALSTYAQCFFGLDSLSALSRYRSLPLRGWRLVLAKDLGYLVILSVLVAPLNLEAGFASGLAAIVVGRHSSLKLSNKRKEWRFTGGDILVGAFQIVAGFSLAVAATRVSAWFLVAVILVYSASVPWGGWLWDRALSRA